MKSQTTGVMYSIYIIRVYSIPVELHRPILTIQFILKENIYKKKSLHRDTTQQAHIQSYLSFNQILIKK